MRHRSVLIAFGGNALLPQGDQGTPAEQLRNADTACRHIVDLVKRHAHVLIVHGNGPQVGNLLIQMEEAALKVPPSPLDHAVALSQGSIGYLLEMALRNHLARRKIPREVVAVLTQVRVDEDPAGLEPTKPIGPFYSRLRAKELKRKGLTMVEDSGRGWRQVVASPRPVEVMNVSVVRELVAAGHVVIAGGGGGVPVRRGRRGGLVGVEAVVDKDHTAALLAASTGASLLVLLTVVSHVSLHFGTDEEERLGLVSVPEMEQYLEAGHFAAGSMRPKIEAVLAFLENGGGEALITDAGSLRAAMKGLAGTRIYRDRVG